MSTWEFFKSGFRNTAEPNFTCEPWSGAWRKFSGCLFTKNEEIKLMLGAVKKKTKKKPNLISACLINSTPWNCWVYRSTINVNSFTWLSLIASYAHTQNYLMEQFKSLPLPPKLSVKEKHEVIPCLPSTVRGDVSEIFSPSLWSEWKSLSHVWQFCKTPWTIQSTEFSRSEYWSG